jgi:hypothetical protein
MSCQKTNQHVNSETMSLKVTMNCLKYSLIGVIMLIYHIGNAQTETMPLNKPFRVLDGKLIINMPDGTLQDSSWTSDDNKLYNIFQKKYEQIYFSKGAGQLIVMSEHLKKTSSGDFKTSLSKYLNNGKVNESTFSQLKTIRKDSNLSIIVFSPKDFLKDPAIKLYKAAYIKLADNSVIIVKLILNQNGKKDINFYNLLSQNIFLSISQGISVNTEKEKQLIVTTKNNKVLTLNYPLAYFAENLSDEKLTTIELTRITDLTDPSRTILTLMNSDSSAIIKSKTLSYSKQPGKVFGKSISWNKIVSKDKKDIYLFNIFDVGAISDNEFFFISLSTNTNRISELKSIAEKITVEN